MKATKLPLSIQNKLDPDDARGFLPVAHRMAITKMKGDNDYCKD